MEKRPNRCIPVGWRNVQLHTERRRHGLPILQRPCVDLRGERGPYTKKRVLSDGYVPMVNTPAQFKKAKFSKKLKRSRA